MKRFEGYHDRKSLPIKPGDTVTIPKGTTVYSRGKFQIAGRRYKVKVHHILNGTSVTIDGEYEKSPGGGLQPKMAPEENPKVCWAGAGGYWCEVDINDIPEVMFQRRH